MAVIKAIPKGEKKWKKAKWLSDEALQILAEKRRGAKGKGEEYPFECRVPKSSKEG